MNSNLNFQEQFYNESVDYRHGSPHLTHLEVYDQLVTLIRNVIEDLARKKLPLTALEVGAGHGGYTEPVLAAGCQVTAVEMSRPSLAALEHRFGLNPGFRGLLDRDGSLSEISTESSLVLCVSVLHHVPDYLSLIRRLSDHVATGGSLVVLQDPLWYPRADWRALRLNTLGYATWRIWQGDYRRAIKTRIRRLRRVYDESNAADMVEYHIVRQGVDELALSQELATSFANVRVISYWTNQTRWCQWLGSHLGLVNTFGIIASDRL